MSLGTSGHALSPLSERSHSPTSSGRRSATVRPQPTRVDTDRILSYYQSSDANAPLEYQDSARGHKSPVTGASRPRISHYRESGALSEYSRDSHDEDLSVPVQSRHRRNNPSEGGSDRRRLHIVQMGQVDASELPKEPQYDQYGRPSTEGLRTRRGHESGLALVAPPDASPKTYFHLTPPSTARPRPRPTSIGTNTPHLPPEDSHAGMGLDSGRHHRSSSEAVSSPATAEHRSPREVSILGTNLKPSEIPPQQLTPNTRLQPPLFQIPQSRSPSPGATTSNTSRSSPTPGQYPTPAMSLQQPILTPDIGQGKDIHDLVAAPIVVTLSPDQTSQWDSSSKLSPQITTPFSPILSSSYLYYQPGVHAIAGPLPPPPRATFSIDSTSPPPPRPPRLHSPPPLGVRRRCDTDAVRQALQMPASTEGQLAENKSVTSLKNAEEKSELGERSRSPDQSDTHANSDAENNEDVLSAKHTREGAFPPSTICTQPRTPSPSPSPSPLPSPLPSSSVTVPDRSPSPGPIQARPQPRPKLSMHDLVADVGDAIDAMGIMSASDVPPPTVIEPPRDSEQHSRAAFEFKRPDSWINANLEITRTSSDEGSSGQPSADHDVDQRSMERVTSREDRDRENRPISPPRRMKTTIANLKRFSSLPRRPSMSIKRLSGGSRSSRSTRTPSPSSHPPPPPSPPLPSPPLPSPPQQYMHPRVKIRTAWPAAMSYGDILTKKSAAERSSGYAMKINELWMSDCGLGEWVFEARCGGNNPSKRATLYPSALSGPSSVHPQRRHVSRSSMTSEATFPKRADAYTATDLSFRATDDPTPPNAPPPLPYPSLAVASVPLTRSIPVRTPSILTSPGSIRSALTSPTSGKSNGGFFSSLGRKTSSKKGRVTPASPTSSSSESRKALSKPQQTPNLNPRPINISNSPSVPGGPRAPPNRMQRSQTIMVSPFSSTPTSSASHRSSTIIRRPSLFGMSTSDPVIDIERKDEFARQVDKLADLLPQADKSVLAGYLKRAGQDILAIGQYLEDEKNGTIRI